MSVRAWFTISAVALAVLAVAFALQIFGPVRPPAVVVRAGEQRLAGGRVQACWPQRSGRVHCTRTEHPRVGHPTVDGSGTLTFVVAYPFQPPDGTIRIVSRDGTVALFVDAWKRQVAYSLRPGRYDVEAVAEYGGGAYLVYDFGLTVTAGGS